MNSVTDITPIVSIIIPCYNQAKFLPDATNSLKAQTIGDWECIIVNDGSKDNTKNVALDICRSDDRFIYFEQENKGLSAARNAGLDIAKGKYIQFLDADDFLLPLKLEKQIEILTKNNNISLSICDYYYCDENDLDKHILESLDLKPNLNPDYTIEDLIERWEDTLSIPAHCFLFDSRLFIEKGVRFDTSLPNHEDWDCWLTIFSFNPVFFYIDEKLVGYRVHNFSMTKNKKLMYSGFIKVIKKQKKKFQSNQYLIMKLTNKQLQLTQKQKAEFIEIRNKALINNSYFIYYKKKMPWPIQKLLSKIFMLP